MCNFNERLLKERDRLGLKKGGMASAGGVANSTYTKYEDGSRLPDAAFLSDIAAAGVDVLYILTGKPSTEKQGDNGKSPAVGDLDIKAAESNGKKTSVGDLGVKATESNAIKPTVGYLKKPNRPRKFDDLFTETPDYTENHQKHVAENTAESPADYLALGDDERQLLDYYRNCEEAVRIAIVEMARVSSRST